MTKVNITDGNHTIGIHALTKTDMEVIIDKFELLFDSSFGTIKYQPGLRNRKIGIKDEHTDHLPHYGANEELRASIGFHMNVPKDRIEDMFAALDIKKKCNKWLWYPRAPIQELTGKIVRCSIKPKYPIYILSKGRHKNPHTANYLMRNNIDFKIVVEPDEYDLYLLKIPKKNILKLPKKYLGLQRGGVPARNFIYHHSLKKGESHHWILDDNITTYYYAHNSFRMKCESGIAFRMLEDYMDRYENLYLCGHHYKMFAIPAANHPLIIHNTRVYSSMLIKNDIPIIEKGDLWLGKYNEDTDLSLRLLLKGLPIDVFMNITCDKLTTGCCKGGNTDTIYKEDSNGSGYLKTKELIDKYPNIAKMVDRYGRKHHFIDYKKHFGKNKLIKSLNLVNPQYDINFVLPD